MDTPDINLITTANEHNSLFSIIKSTDFVGGAVMVMLLIASIWSWTIIFHKIMQIRSTRKKMTAFETTFWSGQVLDQLYENIKRTAIDNPLASIFINAMSECRRKISSNDAVLKISHKDRITQSMYIARNREVEKIEQNLNFLATVGSSTPFVGLFGTVWGIINSFQAIAQSKNATLAVVAPGIAEALLATAIGLFAAIPAVIFYNYLASEANNVNNKIDEFIGELNTIFSRAIDEEKF